MARNPSDLTVSVRAELNTNSVPSIDLRPPASHLLDQVCMAADLVDEFVVIRKQPGHAPVVGLPEGLNRPVLHGLGKDIGPARSHPR